MITSCTANETPIAPTTELFGSLTNDFVLWLWDEDRLGVRIVDEGQTYEVNFATTGRLTGHLRITDSAGEIVVAQDLATDLSGGVQKKEE